MAEIKEFFRKISEESNGYGIDYGIDQISKLVKLEISFLFPKLNIDDKSILINLTIYLINFICSKFHFDKDSIDIKQWTQNNNRDIKACILKILPYIDDNNSFREY